MKKHFLFLFFVCLSEYLHAQTYTIGTQTITWTDPARSNRSVGIDFRYPGTNGVLATGQFPFVIFAHGFSMDQTPYYPYADSLAKRGYIVGLLTTETGFSPSHANFAQDLLFVYDKLISEGSGNNASPFYQKVVAKGAIGGHSMGGGSTVLSAQYGNPQTCSFTFAAATTNPSSITAAHLMTKPYLSFAGSLDCIAPVATHQQPMYDSSGTACKFLIKITGGLHCQYGNANVACSFGEGASGCASSTLTRQQQIDKTLFYLIPYLDYYLKGDCSAWTLFESRYASNTTDVLQRNCTNNIPTGAAITGVNSFCSGSSTILTANPPGFQYLWNDNSTASTLNVNAVGNYSVVVGNGTCSLEPVSVSVTQNLPLVTPSAITASDTVCSGISNIVISVVNDATVTTYNWTLPAGWSITSGNNTNVIQATSGTGGTISVTAQNDCGITPAVTKTIEVVPSNLGASGTIAGPDTLCRAQLAVYSIAPVSGANSYAWNFSGGWQTASDSNVVEVMVNATSGTVSVMAVNECGSSVPSILDVVVDTIPVLEGTIMGPDSVCINGGAGIYYALSIFPTSAYDYNWTIPGGWSFLANGNSPSPIINVASSGTVTVDVTNHCGTSNALSLNVAIVDTPLAQINVNGNTLVASPTGANFYFVWYLNGQVISGAVTDTLIPTQSGDYMVLVGNPTGCNGRSSEISFVYNGLQELRTGVFSIFPNPYSGGDLQILVNEEAIGGKLKIFDAIARLVAQHSVNSLRSSIDISSLAAGIYVLSLEAGEKVMRGKLVVE